MNLSHAYNYLRKPGAVGIIPTDTVYGLAANAKDREAVARLYALKDRDSKPGTVIAASIDQLVDLGLKRRYLSAVSDYWPGPLSVIIPCGPELTYLHQGKFGLAVRLPDDKDLIDLLGQTGPLLTSSANTAGKEPANTIEAAKSYFKDKVDFYIDGGDLSGREPSTIVRVVDDMIEVIRPGAYKIKDQS
ncbi:MAG TPA: L-threonylcarbamoyladenylate synthase [Candidatus Saccharimonadales bacterium]|jgi:tRNA threonylcarbamoyl adenosine modification protein (Sua5/YciO/YrdC/YwlC family)